MKTIDLELVKHIITTWTTDKVDDPRADRDALEAIVASLLDKNDVVEAAALINSWRKHKIQNDKERKPLIDF